VKLSQLLMIWFFVVSTSIVFYQYKVSASDDQVVISKIQTGGSGSGTTLQEFVQIYNNSDQDVNITDWCLQFSSDSNVLTAVYRQIVCLSKPAPDIDLVINPQQHVLFASPAYINANPSLAVDGVFSNATNIPGTNGSIRLLTKNGIVVDTVGWGSGISEGLALAQLSGGSIFKRLLNNESYIDTNNNLGDFYVVSTPLNLESGGISEVIVEVDVCSNISGLQTLVPDGYLLGEDGLCEIDICPNIDGLQIEIPENYEKISPFNDCTKIVLQNAVLLITEILANAPGSDTGLEFIEIYNPNNASVSLVGYRLQIGPSFTKEFEFSGGEIAAFQYLVFSDSETGIVLPNASGVNIRLISPAGTVVSESPTYTNAEDDVSWALVDDQWIYTNQITPQAANLPYQEPAVEEVVGVTTVLAPCPPGKYRNPETNRCRNIETAVASLVPCDEDEYRNPQTNRCNKVGSASVLATCAVGQERNPETNRCRKIVSAELTSVSSDSAIDVKVENTEGQINWIIISAVLLGTLGYIAYEWRSEIRQKLLLMRIQN